MQNHRQQGKRGEQIAANFLTKKGYRIVARNFSSKLGEIDLIATYKETLIFIEVKSRTNLDFGEPYEAVGTHKLRSIANTGRFYALLHPMLPHIQQIDVVSIRITAEGNIKQIEHLENVTG